MGPNPIVERLSIETIKAKSTLIAEIAVQIAGNRAVMRGNIEEAVTLALMADHPPEGDPQGGLDRAEKLRAAMKELESEVCEDSDSLFIGERIVALADVLAEII